MVTGITPSEYIRNRRLSMAGQEMSMSDIKVIDLAYKYGYESPESFAKAFSRFHGVTPTMARFTGARLNSFNRLFIKINLEGGKMLEYRIEKTEPFKLLTKVRQFDNEIIKKDGNEDIPSFWRELHKSGDFEVLKRNAASGDTYGVCAPISKSSNKFDYGIGMLTQSDSAPSGFTLWEVKPTLWAVFKCEGEFPKSIGETWDRIFKEFLPSSEYVMLDETDFELYKEDADECEIWIPVEKK